MTSTLKNILFHFCFLNNFRRDSMAKLLNREEASKYIGIDPKTFDKVFRANPDFKRFPLSDHSERFTIESIEDFIKQKETTLKKI